MSARNVQVHDVGKASADIFCGQWTTRAGHVDAIADRAGSLNDLVSDSAWRAAIDARFDCRAPISASILAMAPARVLQCDERQDHWPYVAVIAEVHGRIFAGAEIASVASLLERAIAVQAGLIAADSVPRTSVLNAITAIRLAQNVSADDIAHYNELLLTGTWQNLAGNGAAAEAAFSSAVLLQQQKLGADHGSAMPIMLLAAQISDDGRPAEAARWFAEADRLVANSINPTAKARLLLYKGLDAINRRDFLHALQLLSDAEAAYKAVIPPGGLEGLPPAVEPGSSMLGRLGPVPDLAGSGMFMLPFEKLAIAGYLEARRDRAMVLRYTGHPSQAAALLVSTRHMLRVTGLADSPIAAQFYRSLALIAADKHQYAQAADDLRHSLTLFKKYLPESRSTAETELMTADVMRRAGRCARLYRTVLPGRRRRARIAKNRSRSRADRPVPCGLRGCRSSAEGPAGAATRFVSCVSIWPEHRDPQGDCRSNRPATGEWPRSGRRKRHPPRARLAAPAQRASGTAQSADHGQQDRHPAIRRAVGRSRCRHRPRTGCRISAEQTLQAEAPRYPQLVQQVVSASDVFAVLPQHEAFVAVALSTQEGCDLRAARPRRVG